MTRLSLERVGKTYPNGVRALDAITLDVAPGEIVAVIGGSGCGKSTLLRAVSGLDAPTEGRVRRVAIARALAPRPQVLLDEPLSALDASPASTCRTICSTFGTRRGQR